MEGPNLGDLAARGVLSGTFFVEQAFGSTWSLHDPWKNGSRPHDFG